MSSTDNLDQQPSRRKARDRSIALLIAGVVLLLPPMVGASIIEARPFDIPFSLVYVFAVWALLIAGAAFLARRLSPPQTTPTPPSSITAPINAGRDADDTGERAS